MESNKDINKKLLSAQKQIGAISKDSTNPFFKSKYFDINGLLAVVKPVLNDNSLILLQPLDGDKLKTILIDADSGESITSIVNLTVNPDPQKMGSVITYFRRYSLQALLAIEAADDDAESATVRPSQTPPKPPVTGKDLADGLLDKKISQTEANKIKIDLNKAGCAGPDFPEFCIDFSIDRVEHLPVSKLPEVKPWIKANTKGAK